MIIIIALMWLICSALAYAATLYDFTKSFPHGNHVGVARLMAFFGPFGLIVVCLAGTNRGLMWKPYSVEKRWELFKEKHEILGREYFDRVYK